MASWCWNLVYVVTCVYLTRCELAQVFTSICTQRVDTSRTYLSNEQGVYPHNHFKQDVIFRVDLLVVEAKWRASWENRRALLAGGDHWSVGCNRKPRRGLCALRLASKTYPLSPQLRRHASSLQHPAKSLHTPAALASHPLLRGLFTADHFEQLCTTICWPRLLADSLFFA